MNGVEEVHPHDSPRALGGRRDLRHTQRRRIGRKDRVRWGQRIQLREQFALELELLRRRLDHQVGSRRRRLQHRRRGQSGERRLASTGIDHTALDTGVEVAADRG